MDARLTIYLWLGDAMDTILRNAGIADGPGAPSVDIGIENGLVAAIEVGPETEVRAYDLGGRLETTSFIPNPPKG